MSRSNHRRVTAAVAVAVIWVSVAGPSQGTAGDAGAGASVSATAERVGNQAEVADVDPFVPPRRAVLISDSVIAVLSATGRTDRLVGTTWFTDLEVCRRLVARSCAVSPYPRPPTVIEELSNLPFRPDGHDLLIVATGYNDTPDRFPTDLLRVVEAAHRSGFEHIAWLSYHSHATGRTAADLMTMNALLDQAVDSDVPISVWDFEEFMLGHGEWVAGDRIHLRSASALPIADWLSRLASSYDVA